MTNNYRRIGTAITISILLTCILLLLRLFTPQFFNSHNSSPSRQITSTEPQKNNGEIIDEMKKSAVNYVDCNKESVYVSKALQLSFTCPKGFVVYECKNPNNLPSDSKSYTNDINLLSAEELDQKIQLFKAYNNDLCYGQGGIQVAVSRNLLYRKPLLNHYKSVVEKHNYVAGNSAVHQILEYEGANEPTYSELVTFKYKDSYFQVRVLNKEQKNIFDQILTSLSFKGN